MKNVNKLTLSLLLLVTAAAQATSDNQTAAQDVLEPVTTAVNVGTTILTFGQSHDLENQGSERMTTGDILTAPAAAPVSAVTGQGSKYGRNMSKKSGNSREDREDRKSEKRYSKKSKEHRECKGNRECKNKKKKRTTITNVIR